MELQPGQEHSPRSPSPRLTDCILVQSSKSIRGYLRRSAYPPDPPRSRFPRFASYPHPSERSKSSGDRKPCLTLLPAGVCLSRAASLGVLRNVCCDVGFFSGPQTPLTQAALSSGSGRQAPEDLHKCPARSVRNLLSFILRGRCLELSRWRK